MTRASRPRVAVYAIARNEERHVDRWVACASPADLLLIADTGSTDNTAERARALGVEVREISVEPFRFDHARNRALSLVGPEVDVCVSLDLDEVLAADWRPQVDSHWREGVTKLRGWMDWRWSREEAPLQWTVERIHIRDRYRWQHPVHECLVTDGPERIARSSIRIHHLREPGAARLAYLELLRLAVAESPEDPRLAHLLANDARMRGQAEEAQTWFRRTLELSPAPNERLHSMLMLSHLEPAQRESLLLTACAEFEHRREPWCELTRLHLDQGRRRAALATAHRALAIDEPADDYLANPFVWGTWPDQMASSAAGELHEREWEAHHVLHARRAMSGPQGHAPAGRQDDVKIDFVTISFNDPMAANRVGELLEQTVRVPYTFGVIDNTIVNVGWASACNASAAGGQGDLIAFIDQDVELSDGWLEPVLEAFNADSRLVIAGPRCVDGLPWPRVPAGLQSWVCGACMLVRRDFFVAVGGFDADSFPHEYAETDLERTAELRGYRVETIETVSVLHRIAHVKSDRVLGWRARAARNEARKWGLPLDRWGVAHERPGA